MNNGVPDSPAGRRLRQVFDGMSGTAGLDAAEAFHPSFLASVSADAIAAHLAALASALGRFAFECDESHTPDHRTSGVVRGLHSARRVDCAVDAEPPHQITSLVFSPIPFEQGDLDDVPRMMTHHGCVGLTAAMLVDGEIAWARGWGMADADAHRPMTPDTFVQVGSISKPVAAAAVARLAEEGLVAVDADVNDYLKSWRLPVTGSWQPSVSLRRILTHTAGLSVWGFPGYRAVPQRASSNRAARLPPMASSEGHTAMTSSKPSRLRKSSALRVYSGSSRASAVAAMRRSTARAPRALRPATVTAA